MGNIVAPRDEMVAAGAPIGQVDNDCYSSSPVYTDTNVPPDEWEEPHEKYTQQNGGLHKPHGKWEQWRPPRTAWGILAEERVAPEYRKFQLVSEGFKNSRLKIATAPC